MALEIEKATYKAHLEELRPHQGEWVLIRDTEIVDIYSTWDAAIQAAHEKFGVDGFCIIQIETVDFVWVLPVGLDHDVEAKAA